MSEGMSNVIEKRKEKAYFTFGRYQPPTIGHYSLIDQMKTQADANGADAYVFMSSKHEPGKPNSRWPLNAGTKYSIFKKRYPSYDTGVRFITNYTTAFNAFDALKSNGYTDITIFLGSDQAGKGKTLGQQLRTTYADDIKVEAIERDVTSEANSPQCMSGTKLRQYALSGEIEKFSIGIGIPRPYSDQIMNVLLVYLGKPSSTLGAGKAGGTRRQRHTKQKKRRQTRRR